MHAVKSWIVHANIFDARSNLPGGSPAFTMNATGMFLAKLRYLVCGLGPDHEVTIRPEISARKLFIIL